MIYESWVDECDIGVVINVQHYSNFYSLHFHLIWVGVLIAIFYKRKLLWWGLAHVLVYGYKYKKLGKLDPEKQLQYYFLSFLDFSLILHLFVFHLGKQRKSASS